MTAIVEKEFEQHFVMLLVFDIRKFPEEASRGNSKAPQTSGVESTEGGGGTSAGGGGGGQGISKNSTDPNEEPRSRIKVQWIFHDLSLSRKLGKAVNFCMSFGSNKMYRSETIIFASQNHSNILITNPGAGRWLPNP